MISRTGPSADIVNLVPKARQARANIIGVTDSGEGTLAQEGQIPLVIPVGLDHAISVNTYSTLSVAVSALASAGVSSFDFAIAPALTGAAKALAGWQEQISTSGWLAAGSRYYFLARSTSLGSFHGVDCDSFRLCSYVVEDLMGCCTARSSVMGMPEALKAKELPGPIYFTRQRKRSRRLSEHRDYTPRNTCVGTNETLRADYDSLI